MLIGRDRPLSPDAGVKVLGERNSGTRVLETLLRENVDVHLHENIPILSPDMTPAPPDGPFPKGDKGQAAHEAMTDHMHHAQLPDNGAGNTRRPITASHTFSCPGGAHSDAPQGDRDPPTRRCRQLRRPRFKGPRIPSRTALRLDPDATLPPLIKAV